MKKIEVTTITSVKEIHEQKTFELNTIARNPLLVKDKSPINVAQSEKRKMFRFGEKAHKLAKIIAALDGKTIQDYIDDLVTKDARKRYPKIYKDNFPND